MSTSQRRRSSGVVGFLRETAIVVIGALIASTLLRMFLLQVFVIPSGSMENTLLIGDRVAVQKVSGFQRGDIVVFRDDYGWMPASQAKHPGPWQSALMFLGLLPDEGQTYLVKRAIGVAGDHVVCCDASGRLTVNGAALDETTYLFADSAGQQVVPSEMKFDLVVPQGKIFVMGDHRNASADSRCHLATSYNGVLGGSAFISTTSVVGSVVATVIPFDRIGGHQRPATFAGVPSASGTAPPAPVLNGQPPGPC